MVHSSAPIRQQSALDGVRMAQAEPPDPCFGECDWWAAQSGDRSHVARPVLAATGSEDGTLHQLAFPNVRGLQPSRCNRQARPRVVRSCVCRRPSRPPRRPSTACAGRDGFNHAPPWTYRRGPPAPLGTLQGWRSARAAGLVASYPIECRVMLRQPLKTKEAPGIGITGASLSCRALLSEARPRQVAGSSFTDG
jgi:hypothetical protein